MIRSFADKDTQRFQAGGSVARFMAFEQAARRRLDVLDRIATLHDLKGRSFSLEALHGKRSGQHSIRINRQYRICFVWRDGDAFDVEITDYHGERK